MPADNVRVISREDLSKWLDQMLGSFTVVAPVAKDDYTNFAVIQSGREADLSRVNSRMSPKHLFFPKTERLFGFAGRKDGVEISGQEEQISPQVLFGVRPCDARAVTMLDKVFDTDVFRDTRYVARREATTIVSLACNQLCPSCFCTRVGGNAADTAGSDIIMIELPDGRYGLKALTQKGQGLLGQADLPAEASAQDGEVFEKALQEAGEAGKTTGLDVPGMAKKLGEMFDSEYWERTHQRCLGCGTCTYLCPTCHCFDIADEAVTDTGQRVRNWDSCMFDLFTLHASGHNPRPSQKQHLRQRIMHKFSYTVDRFGEAFCVGCGRCVTRCPVNIDVREILDELESYGG